jgi:hypothetical protein
MHSPTDESIDHSTQLSNAANLRFTRKFRCSCCCANPGDRSPTRGLFDVRHARGGCHPSSHRLSTRSTRHRLILNKCGRLGAAPSSDRGRSHCRSVSRPSRIDARYLRLPTGSRTRHSRNAMPARKSKRKPFNRLDCPTWSKLTGNSASSRAEEDTCNMVTAASFVGSRRRGQSGKGQRCPPMSWSPSLMLLASAAFSGLCLPVVFAVCPSPLPCHCIGSQVGCMSVIRATSWAAAGLIANG